MVQPDVLLVCDSAKIDRRGVRGAPDWVAEVLAQHGGARPDRQAPHLRARRRARILAGAPTDRTLTVHWLVDGRYGIPEISELKGSTALAILPEVAIAWDALVARLPPVEL